jgi:putative sugar O-methyltransferase
MKSIIQHTIRISLLLAALLTVEEAMGACDKRFAVIIPSRNNSKWCERNLEALRTQSYDNWYAIYINDASTDDTRERVEQFINTHHLEDKIMLINNEERQGAMANIYKAVHMCADSDIIVNYDGDDWFSGPDTLAILNRAYADENVWMTYGSYEEYPSGQKGWWVGPISSEAVMVNDYRVRRAYCTVHLRTFYAWLFKRIKEEDLKVDGVFFPMTYDLAMMFPMFEMAGGRFKYITDVLYVYNMDNPSNDYKIDRELQLRMDDIIRSRTPYQPLKEIVLPQEHVAVISQAESSSRANWKKMQTYYSELLTTLASKKDGLSDSDMCKPYWQSIRPNIQKLVEGAFNPNFLNHQDVFHNMVRSGMGSVQDYELCFLKECVSKSTKEKLQRFQDTRFSNLPVECSAFNCSVNTLGNLFYAARTVDLMEEEPQTIVEFGAGYGNLSRVYNSFFPDSTYIIIDLPEVLALQYFFLKETLPNKNIIFHTDVPKAYYKDCIHLIPVNYLKDVEFATDLFVSTFALSEASDMAQDIIHHKKFFDAKLVYIVGQLNGWDALNFVHHTKIHSSLRSYYKHVDCHPYHLLMEKLKSYEIIAKRFGS